jgi:hypothetical protein
MITLLSSHYQLEHVSENDIIIASLTWGVTIGFGALTVWSAIKQTVSLYQRRKGISSSLVTPYIVMIWIELIVCTTFSIICWLYLRGLIKPRSVSTHLEELCIRQTADISTVLLSTLSYVSLCA